jgi:hypothetical protein
MITISFPIQLVGLCSANGLSKNDCRCNSFADLRRGKLPFGRSVNPGPSRQFLPLLGLIALFFCTLPAVAQRTMNRGLHAPPVKTPVVVDGKLDEWDLSGTITCTKDFANLLDLESCKVAAMWDDQGIYLSFRFRDPSPMVNQIDPVTMPGNGWRSDCVQLRLNMAGFVSHVDAWYYTDGKKPGMTIGYGRFGVKDGGQPKVDRPKYPEELGARQAFRMAEDKAGYTQELFLPWQVITLDGKMPPPDADLRVGLEMFWGGVTTMSGVTARMVDNLSDKAKTVDFFWKSDGNWGKLIRETENDLNLPTPPWLKQVTKAEPNGIVPITFDLPKESYVTIAIEDAAGNRVRSLLGGVKFAAGEHTVMWDGLDDRDQLLPTGKYRWIGLYRDAIDIRIGRSTALSQASRLSGPAEPLPSATFSRQVADSPASCTAEEGEKERAHAEDPAIGANRFLIAFNAATGASVAKGWHQLTPVDRRPPRW